MYYEIYLDSLFLTNFVMNLYLLMLVGKMNGQAVPGRRVVWGAMVGAVLFLFPFCLSVPVWIRVVVGAVPGCAGMLLATFRIKTFKGFWILLERLLLCSFLMGGGMLVILRYLPKGMYFREKSMGVMGAAALFYLALAPVIRSAGKREAGCEAILICGDKRVRTRALVDSGNGLWEPLSGKPVSVIDRSVFESLWEFEPEGYRAVPFRSVGCKQGILKGYFLTELQIERQGIRSVCRDVCVAVNQDDMKMGESPGRKGTKAVGILLHPALLRDQ